MRTEKNLSGGQHRDDAQRGDRALQKFLDAGADGWTRASGRGSKTTKGRHRDGCARGLATDAARQALCRYVEHLEAVAPARVNPSRTSFRSGVETLHSEHFPSG